MQFVWSLEQNAFVCGGNVFTFNSGQILTHTHTHSQCGPQFGVYSRIMTGNRETDICMAMLVPEQPSNRSDTEFCETSDSALNTLTEPFRSKAEQGLERFGNCALSFNPHLESLA